MVWVSGHSDRLSAYAQLSMWERHVLAMWIEEDIDLTVIWGYTSLGLKSLFEESEFGFRVTHQQLQQAMLSAGYRIHASFGELWMFDPPLAAGLD